MTIPIRIQCSKSYPPQEGVMREKPRHAVLKMIAVLAVTLLLCLIAAELMAMEEAYQAAARV